MLAKSRQIILMTTFIMHFETTFLNISLNMIIKKVKRFFSLFYYDEDDMVIFSIKKSVKKII